MSLRALARHLGLSRQTVQLFALAPTFPERHPRAARPTLLTPYEASLRHRWDAGCQNAAVLFREPRDQGFAGSAGLVRVFLAGWRTAPGRRGGAARRADPAAPPAPPPVVRVRLPRQARWLLLRPEGDLTPEQQAYRALLEADCAEIATARPLAQE